MRKLKVFGGLTFQRIDGKQKQVRTIIAVPSKKKLQEILTKHYQYTSMYEINNHWTETGNEAELEIALENPGTIFISTGIFDKQFRGLK